MLKRKVLCILSGVMLTACSVVAADMPPVAYNEWLSNLKHEMSERGISQPTLDAAFAKNYYHPQHNAVKQDRRQNEFVLLPSAYLRRVVSPLRVKQGRKLFAEMQGKYPDGMSGVPLHYLLAFWGIETNYGANKGGYNAIEALTVLSYDRRRSAFFREELYNALKIIDDGNVGVGEMESSWAGAMGHFQFMPSTFNAYGVDANNDGRIDIWHDFPDALASAANYLSAMGWQSDEPWGVPVSLSWNYDYTVSGRRIKKTVSEWRRQGVSVPKDISGKIKASLLLPEGHRGQSYLVFENFNIIMRWNHSESYALAVGLLADSLKTGKAPSISADGYIFRPAVRDIKKVQEFINRQRLDKLEADGRLGSATRAAVQKLQLKFRLPADGYPDERLLDKIRDFAVNGYEPPIPSRKLHRGK